jgi:hypothetical protein
MPDFTIEIGFTTLIRHFRNYTAPSLEKACRSAQEDENWVEQKEAFQEAGATEIFGIWEGHHNAYCRPTIPIPA